MFCRNCGKQINDAKFCPFCGTPSGNVDVSNQQKRETLIPGKCTFCGAALEVDSSLEAAVCPYCHTPYIVQKAIENYSVSVTGNMTVANATINVAGVNVENLLLRAIDYEEMGDLINALAYYDRVLDQDINNIKAKEGLIRVKQAIDDYVYYSSDATAAFSFGKLCLKKGKLVFIKKNGKDEKNYDLSSMTNITKSMGCVCFDYPKGLFGSTSQVSYGTTSSDAWVRILQDAKAGSYPDIMAKKKNGNQELEEYIRSHYNRKSIVEAIKVYREKSGLSLREAKDAVEKIL